MTVLADTGAVYALLDRSDKWHDRVLAWWGGGRRDVLLPVTILPETTYLLHQRIGPHAEAEFIRAVDGGDFEWVGLDERDVTRAADLLQTYCDQPIGFVDASIVAMAERLGVTTILTTDRRHFGVIRPSHTEAFVLAP